MVFVNNCLGLVLLYKTLEQSSHCKQSNVITSLDNVELSTNVCLSAKVKGVTGQVGRFDCKEVLTIRISD